MSFETLINKPMIERQLLDAIVGEIQANFDTYQDKRFYIKLSKTNAHQSEIVWVKTFTCASDLIDFYHDTKFERACIMIKPGGGRYALLCHGHVISDCFEIFLDRILNSRPFASIKNLEQHLMVPREISESAFGEISQALSTTKRLKTM